VTAHAARYASLSGIKFPGAPYEQTFFVADTEATGSMKPGELNVYLWKDGFHLFFPDARQGRLAVIGILPKNLRQRDDLTFEDVVPAIQQEAGTNLNFKGVPLVLHLPHLSPRRRALPRPAAASYSVTPRTFTARPVRRA
jgi:hypothetical protein